MYFRTRKSKGQTLIEFALVLPILLLITLAILEFGRLFWAFNAVSNATREGARAAIVTPDLTYNDVRIKEAALKFLKDAALSTEGVEVTNNRTTISGEFVKVGVTLPYKWLTPLPNFILRKDPPIIMREAEMRYEGEPGRIRFPFPELPDLPDVPFPELPDLPDVPFPEIPLPEVPLGLLR